MATEKYESRKKKKADGLGHTSTVMSSSCIAKGRPKAKETTLQND
jgi:hypothetical protein